MILIFAVENVVLLVLRETDRQWYRPSYRVPLYPLTPIAGIVLGLALLATLGLVAVAAIAAIVIAGTLVYVLYGRRQTERTLRVWCAAASTGQEPYSLGMLLLEHFPQLSSWDMEFIATDLSLEVLEKAREGIYSQAEVNRGLPAKLLVRFFQQKGNTFQLKDNVRSMIEFRQLNLIENWPHMGPVDLLFVRNVLIYFDVETKRKILEKMRNALHPEGSLFLGASETTLNIHDGFQRTQFAGGGCYRIKQT